jgi:hypothetical protein
MDQLSVEIAASVLKFLDFNELIKICETRLPNNFDSAIKEKKVWKQKVLNIKNMSDVRKCLKNIERVKNCIKVSFASGTVSNQGMLTLLNEMDGVEHLSLDNFMNLDDETMKIILEKHGKSLKQLSIKGCQYLTNFSLSKLSGYCKKLVSLNISECSFSSAGLELIAENDNLMESLKFLDVSKCYLLDLGAIMPISKLTNLTSLSLRNLEWLSSNNLPYIIQNMKNISKIDVRNCDEFTKQSVEHVKSSVDHPIEIIENTKLVDESPESIRGYLMAMINAQIV